jgi:hypothetical protein
MGYVVYHKASTMIPVTLRSKVYKTHGAAQAWITRQSKAWFNDDYKPNYPNVSESEDPRFIYAIAEAEYYRQHIEKTVTRTNLMTGAEYEESVNTPAHMSPARESYWSM